ncbi:STAS domain-containing protein [Spirillospora albida]|uniref:STAS domain-containing protein n=1 Tax=Spirillospora albida TaxID=58123 RepID=UPI000689D780|nr:STAS domain-containing protein [Spirillospora albida]
MNDLAAVPRQESASISAAVEPLMAGITLVTLRGELDLATCGALDDLLAGLAGPGTPYLAIDAAEVAFCDSQGLRTLLAADERARSFGGRLCFVHPSAPLRRVLLAGGLAERLLPPAPPDGVDLPCRL